MRLETRNIPANMTVIPVTSGKSLFFVASTARRPNPGHANTVFDYDRASQETRQQDGCNGVRCNESVLERMLQDDLASRYSLSASKLDVLAV